MFHWLPSPTATRYRLEVASDSSFSEIVDRVTTSHTAWAPTLDKRGFLAGGPLYWRLAKVDEGGNVGAYATGGLSLAKSMRMSIKGVMKRGRSSTAVVQVLNAKNKPLANATVNVSGAGTRTVRKRANKRGVVRVRIRPTKKGALKYKSALKGYRTAVESRKIG